MIEPQRTKEDWDRIMKGAEAKQNRINKAVSLQAAAKVYAEMFHNRPGELSNSILGTQITDLARELEKYLKEK